MGELHTGGQGQQEGSAPKSFLDELPEDFLTALSRQLVTEFGYIDRFGTPVEFNGISILPEEFLLDRNCRHHVIPLVVERDKLAVGSEEYNKINDGISIAMEYAFRKSPPQ